MKTIKKQKANKSPKSSSAKVEEIAMPDPDFSKLPINAAFQKKEAHRRTRTDRFEAGRALRAACPREAHAEFNVGRARRKDPIKLLIESSVGRLEELLPIRYGRMVASPFAFYRGASITGLLIYQRLLLALMQYKPAAIVTS